MRDYDFWLVGEEFVDGLSRAYPSRIGIFVKHDDPSSDNLAVEYVEGNFVGFVQVTVEMQERDLSLVRRQGLVKESLHELHAISNDSLGNSTIAQEADANFFTFAGKELAIPATKSFTTQLTILYLMALFLARKRGRMTSEVTRSYLQRLMRRKAEEEIYDVFLWREGEFHFIEDELPKSEMIPLQVDVTGIIMEGTRRLDEWSRIRQVVASDAVVPILQRAIDDASLSDVERTIINAVDGRRTIADIVLESRSSSFIVSSTTYHRIREGEIRLAEIAPAQAAKVAEEAAPAPAAAPMSDDDEIMGLLTRAQQALRAKDFEKAQRLLKASQNLDPNHPKVRAAVKGAETVIVNELKTAGVGDAKVPRVARPFEELTTMNFTPNEGFLLSRINGTWDIGSLVKISPIREPDALLIFYKLWKDGIIALE